jgi:predicted N-acetyltransferase YhbS
MNITIRKERLADHKIVFKIIEESFRNENFSDKREHFLVDRLRKSDAFVNELSLVAESEDTIVGHILLTKIKIKNGKDVFNSLALAPVTVLPKFQKRGIGGMLIKAAHKKAKELGFTSIVLLGHEEYYPRFGYELISNYGIKLPFEAPEKNCMIIALTENGLDGVIGKVEYPKEFFE